jgi:hypothetical protein
MNTTSDRPGIPRFGAHFRARLAALASPWRVAVLASGAAAVLAACIQGPWDYYPENPPVYRGVTVYAYALADRPLQRVCFERLLDLKEEATQAFAFYDSADVHVQGIFSGVERDLALTAIRDTPNCFIDTTAALVERGRNYAMTATLVWDSAGTRVTTVVRGTAKVPALFEIHDSAAAPSLAKSGGIPPDMFTFEFFSKLPDDVSDTLRTRYPEILGLLAKHPTKADRDTSKELAAYLKANGDGIRSTVLRLLQNKQTIYHQGDTLVYLNGVLNTLSHYYSSDRSPDVGAVLITQQFDPAGSRPETAFDSPLGFEPDSEEYYFPGNQRRLIVYQDAKNTKGWSLLDSMGVVNVWFHTRSNRLLFYGMEKAYYDYLSTVMNEGGGGEADPRIIPKFNVTGARGIFVGGIPDTFDLVIETDGLTKFYPLPLVHGIACREDGWFSRSDCRNYYREWCDTLKWATGDCRVDVVMASLEAEFRPDPVLKAKVQAIADTVALDTTVYRIALNEFCVNDAFEAPVCAAPKTACLETSGKNACKEALWRFCLDNSWRPDQCDPGLASYCRDKPRLSEVLCRQADKWCADPAHAGSPLCK